MMDFTGTLMAHHLHNFNVDHNYKLQAIRHLVSHGNGKSPTEYFVEHDIES